MLLIYKDFIENQAFRFIYFETILLPIYKDFIKNQDFHFIYFEMIMLLISKDFIENQDFRFIHFETISLAGFVGACNRPYSLVVCELPNNRRTSPVGPPAEYKTDPSGISRNLHIRICGCLATRPDALYRAMTTLQPTTGE